MNANQLRRQGYSEGQINARLANTQQKSLKGRIQDAIEDVLEGMLIADAAMKHDVTTEALRTAMFARDAQENVPDDPLPSPYVRCPSCGKQFNTKRCVYCHTLARMDKKGVSQYTADRLIIEMVKMTDANFRRSPGPERLG